MKCRIVLSSISSVILIQACGGDLKKSPGAGSQKHFDLSKATLIIPSTLVQNTAQTLSLDSNGNLNPEAERALNLTGTDTVAVNSYIIKVASCSSGFVQTNEIDGRIHLYPQDSDCVGQLTSFVLNGQTYTPKGSGAVPFTSYKVGSVGVFQGADAHDLVDVKVLTQLSSPVQSTDTVRYEFSTNHTETNANHAEDQGGLSISLTGTDAPNFKINEGDASLVSIVFAGPSTGAGQFNIKLTCSTGPMTVGANPNYNSFCPDLLAGGKKAEGASGVDIATHFSYKLIAAPNENGTLSFEQAEASFAEGGDTKVTLSKDIVSDSSGFQTVTLTGPVTITSHPKMMLILQAKNTDARYSNNPAYSSFQYFPINLAPLN